MSIQEDEDELLLRLRHWLRETGDEAQAERDAQLASPEGPPDALAEPPSEPPAEVGLLDLVEQFTALRHEVKLQTKAARGAQEQSDQLIDALRQAVEALESIEPQEAKAAEEFARPLVEAIIGLDEALSRAQQTIESARRRITEEAPDQARQGLRQALASQPWWRRPAADSLRPDIERICLEGPASQSRQILDSLAEGWSLILSRLRRAMREADIERMRCVGEMADPSRMTVIEVVPDPSRRPGEVLAEARPGYMFRGKVFRFAEVTAVAAGDSHAGAPKELDR